MLRSISKSRPNSRNCDVDWKQKATFPFISIPFSSKVCFSKNPINTIKLQFRLFHAKSPNSKLNIWDYIEAMNRNIKVPHPENCNTYVFKDGLFEKAENLFHEITKKSWTMNSNAYEAYLVSLAGQSKIPEVLNNLNELSQKDMLNTSTLNAILKQFQLMEDMDAMETLFSFMKSHNIPPDTHTFDMFIDIAGNRGDLRLMSNWMTSMATHGLQPSMDTHCILIRNYAKVNDEKTTQMWVDRLLRFSDITVSAFNTILRAYITLGIPHRGVPYYQELKDRNLVPDMVTMQTLMGIFLKLEDADAAMLLYSDLIEFKLKPTHDILAALIHLCSKAGKMRAMSCAYGEMKIHNITPSENVFITLIDAFGKSGDLDTMKIVYERMVEVPVRPSMATITTMIRHFADKEDFDSVHRMVKSALTMGYEVEAQMYESLLDAHVKAHKPEMAVGLMELMKTSGVKPSVKILTSLIHHYGKAQKYDEMMKVYTQLKEIHELDVKAYTALIQGLASCNKVEDALQIFEEARGLKKVNHITYSVLFAALGGKTDTSNLMEIYNKMKEDDIKLREDGYAAILRSLGEENYESIKKVKEDMKKAGISVNKKQVKKESLINVH